MNSKEIILNKLELWAKRNNIKLVGSETISGREIYCDSLEDNFFMPISEDIKEMFKVADGGELTSKGNIKAKMNALHSSSALGLNIFQYWINKDISQIASACGFCRESNKISSSIVFEEKYIIDKSFQKSPNIDVVIKNKKNSKIEVFAIECKFTEAYPAKKQSGVQGIYLKKDIWKDLPNLKQLAIKISPDEKDIKHLHIAQLIKHILGLNEKYKNKKAFKLLYLWYDTFGCEGQQHRSEIEEFKKIAKKDKINFISLSYQELIVKLYKKHYQNHKDYIDYLASRYL